MDEMLRGTTESGFPFEVKKSVFDSYDLLKALRAVAKGRVDCLVDAFELLLGSSEEAERFVCKRDGQCTITGMNTLFQEIFEAANALKNSSTSPSA